MHMPLATLAQVFNGAGCAMLRILQIGGMTKARGAFMSHPIQVKL